MVGEIGRRSSEFLTFGQHVPQDFSQTNDIRFHSLKSFRGGVNDKEKRQPLRRCSYKAKSAASLGQKAKILEAAKRKDSNGVLVQKNNEKGNKFAA